MKEDVHYDSNYEILMKKYTKHISFNDYKRVVDALYEVDNWKEVTCHFYNYVKAQVKCVSLTAKEF